MLRARIRIRFILEAALLLWHSLYYLLFLIFYGSIPMPTIQKGRLIKIRRFQYLFLGLC